MSHGEVISIALSGGPDRRSFVVDGKVKSQKNMQSWLKGQLTGTRYLVLPRATRDVELLVVPDDVELASASKLSTAHPEAKSIQLSAFLAQVTKKSSIKSASKVESKTAKNKGKSKTVNKTASKSKIKASKRPSKRSPSSSSSSKNYVKDELWNGSWRGILDEKELRALELYNGYPEP